MANARRKMFETRKLRQQYESQLNEERNGAPTPPDIAELMTKPKVREQLFQCWADVIEDDGALRAIPVSPKIGAEVCDQFLIAINAKISLGHLRGWSNARIEPVTAL